MRYPNAVLVEQQQQQKTPITWYIPVLKRPAAPAYRRSYGICARYDAHVSMPITITSLLLLLEAAFVVLVLECG